MSPATPPESGQQEAGRESPCQNPFRHNGNDWILQQTDPNEECLLAIEATKKRAGDIKGPEHDKLEGFIEMLIPLLHQSLSKRGYIAWIQGPRPHWCKPIVIRLLLFGDNHNRRAYESMSKIRRTLQSYKFNPGSTFPQDIALYADLQEDPTPSTSDWHPKPLFCAQDLNCIPRGFDLVAWFEESNINDIVLDGYKNGNQIEPGVLDKMVAELAHKLSVSDSAAEEPEESVMGDKHCTNEDVAFAERLGREAFSEQW